MFRQTDSTAYTTAQNDIRMALITTESSGVVLQLGDPFNTQEYLVIEVCYYVVQVIHLSK